MFFFRPATFPHHSWRASAWALQQAGRPSDQGKAAGGEIRKGCHGWGGWGGWGQEPQRIPGKMEETVFFKKVMETPKLLKVGYFLRCWMRRPLMGKHPVQWFAWGISSGCIVHGSSWHSILCRGGKRVKEGVFLACFATRDLIKCMDSKHARKRITTLFIFSTMSIHAHDLSTTPLPEKTCLQVFTNLES